MDSGEKRMSKKVIIVSIVIVVIINIAYVCIADKINMFPNRPVVFEEMRSIERLSFIEAGTETEGSLCLIAPEGESLNFYQIILDKYIYSRKIKGQRCSMPEGDADYIEKFDEDIIELYNFRTGEIEKTLELVSIAEENTPGKQFNSWDRVNAKVIDGKRYLGWRVYPIEDAKNYTESEIITYSLEEGKVVEYINVAPSSKYTEKEKEYFKTFYIFVDRWCNFLEVNGFTRGEVEEGEVYITYTNSWKDGIIEVEMLASLLPKNNARLYAEFPELKEYDIKEGDSVKLFFAGYPDAEDILGMLIEDGNEITYEGCILSIGDTIDRKEHEISCMDDYITWRNWKNVSRYLE